MLARIRTASHADLSAIVLLVAFGLLVLQPVLHAEFVLVDDHEILRLTLPDAPAPLSQLSNRVLSDDRAAGRFRPIYWVARLGETNLVRDRGNLPDAESGYRGLIEMLTSVIGHGMLAEEAVPMAALRAEVRHELANVLHARERPIEAIEVAREAWGEPAYAKRDRLLVDSAAYLRDVGALEAARDASLLALALAGQGGEPFAGWMASTNLLEIAIDERNETAFEHYRVALSRAPLPPFLEAGYYTYLARGYLTFGGATGDRERALKAAQHAGRVAAAHSLHQWVFAAEALAAQAEGPTGSTSTTKSTWDRRVAIPPDRAEVVAGAAADLHAARVAAGV